MVQIPDDKTAEFEVTYSDGMNTIVMTPPIDEAEKDVQVIFSYTDGKVIKKEVHTIHDDGGIHVY